MSAVISPLAEGKPAPPVALPEAPLTVYRVPASAIDLVWPQVVPLLEPAIRRVRDCFTSAHVYQLVRAGQQQLWVATENGNYWGAIVSEVHKHPSGKLSLHLVLAGGRGLRRWFGPAFERTTEYAHLNGCTKISVIGRKGWLRYFAPHGFELEGFIVSREEV